MSTDTKPAVKLETARTTVNVGEKIGQATIDAGSRIGQSAADTTARIGQIGQAASQQAFAAGRDFFGCFSEFKIPGAANAQALADFHASNLQSGAACLRILLDGWQNCVQRQMELTQQLARHCCEATRQLSSNESGHNKAVYQIEAARQRLESSLTAVQGIHDTVHRSFHDSEKVFHQRLCDGLNEIKTIVESCQSHSRPV